MRHTAGIAFVFVLWTCVAIAHPTQPSALSDFKDAMKHMGELQARIIGNGEVIRDQILRMCENNMEDRALSVSDKSAHAAMFSVWNIVRMQFASINRFPGAVALKDSVAHKDRILQKYFVWFSTVNNIDSEVTWRLQPSACRQLVQFALTLEAPLSADIQTSLLTEILKIYENIIATLVGDHNNGLGTLLDHVIDESSATSAKPETKRTSSDPAESERRRVANYADKAEDDEIEPTGTEEDEEVEDLDASVPAPTKQPETPAQKLQKLARKYDLDASSKMSIKQEVRGGATTAPTETHPPRKQRKKPRSDPKVDEKKVKREKQAEIAKTWRKKAVPVDTPLAVPEPATAVKTAPGSTTKDAHGAKTRHDEL